VRVGDLVRNIYTQEIYLVTKTWFDYVDVNGKWHIPKDHLEVINEN